MNGQSVAHAPQTRRPLSVPARPASKMLDDASAEEVFKLADALAQDLEKLRNVINVVSRSTYEEPALNRRRARKQVLEIWHGMAVAARILAQPAPKFRPNSGNPRPIVRRDPEVAGVADLKPISLPFLVEG